jgi:hypothetical protein
MRHLLFKRRLSGSGVIRLSDSKIDLNNRRASGSEGRFPGEIYSRDARSGRRKDCARALFPLYGLVIRPFPA